MARSARVRVEVFADLHAEVGEAPHWDERTSTLLFVDLPQVRSSVMTSPG